MPIKSYLAFSENGKLAELTSHLNEIAQCEVIPSENTDLLILVTDTDNQKEEEQLITHLNGITHLHHLSMVAGFDAPINA